MRWRTSVRPWLVVLSALLWASSASIVHAGNNIWTSIGPGGPVYALAIDPTTPTTLYAGTVGGVFKSTTGGSSWSAVNSGPTYNLVQALAIDPITPTTLYAGTFAYSTDFCHPVHGNVATQSMGMLPPSPEDFCHRFHGNVATLGA